MNSAVMYRAINRMLRFAGLKLIRVETDPRDLDPISRLMAKGLSTAAYNSSENMDEFYSDPNVLTQYFTKDRIDFYDGVCALLDRLGVQPKSVLDVGCGSGHLLARVRSLWPSAELRGIDFSQKSVELAQRLHPSIEFQGLSVFDLSQIDSKFDLILCTEVLEHLQAADEAIEKLYSRCAPGGSVVITVPDGRSDTFSGHFNFWTPESFGREFRRFNPVVEKFRNYLFIVIEHRADIVRDPVNSLRADHDA